MALGAIAGILTKGDHEGESEPLANAKITLMDINNNVIACFQRGYWKWRQEPQRKFCGASPGFAGLNRLFQVYFEVENLDEVYAELKSISSLQWVHGMKEYPWGQCDIRV